MAEFKGFEDWIEIFQGGKQTDATGREHDGDAMIDKAVATFDAGHHEPPIVVGHPKGDSPAFGWIKELKSEAVGGVKRLFARAGEVVPEFEELVKAGRFKKRSAAFYPDGRLRHVGFLGAVPPAVKGLADLKFEEDGEPVSFEFYDHNLGRIGRMFARLREWLIEKDGIEVADRIIPDWDVDDMKQEANRPEDGTSAVYNEENKKTEVEMPEEKQFSEADVKAREEAAAAKAKEDARKEVEREFAEKERKRGIDEFIARNFPKDGPGKLPPALLDAGVREFMEQLDGGEQIEFAEGKTATPLTWFMNFLEGLDKSGLFREVATRDKDKLPDNDDAEGIARRAREFQESEAKAGRTVSVSQAVAHVTGK